VEAEVLALMVVAFPQYNTPRLHTVVITAVVLVALGSVLE
jgi:hypothetical protein